MSCASIASVDTLENFLRDMRTRYPEMSHDAAVRQIAAGGRRATAAAETSPGAHRRRKPITMLLISLADIERLTLSRRYPGP